MSIHSQLLKRGRCPDVLIANHLIDMYAASGFLDGAQRLFGEMPHRNVVSWTTLISAQTRAGHPDLAIETFTRMLNHGSEEPNGYTYSAALKACAVVGDHEFGRWIHRHVLNNRLQSDVVLMNAVIDMYIKCGSFGEARFVFDELSLANSTSWNMMIAGYFRKGSAFEAENLFSQFSKPDAISYNTMISGFAEMESPKALDYVYLMHSKVIPWVQGGKQVHAYIVKGGFESESITVTSLIDMYSKCGEIDDGFKVFESEVEKDTVCWTGIITGCGSNGRATEALKLFREMIKAGVEPNEITFLSVLSACRHAGLVSEEVEFSERKAFSLPALFPGDACNE
ncbi:Pentatricopeptide repeat-containing protein [Musa troglodytarum]|uniref:Pentatricopeptide repeat-containing protein n=1 Tax=Musa troglodytarum TaxID=320322 RepID=A0A9E7L2Q3_9LILI|nr:Pentatricopeptide repeat-containing protein [Musa troglodytarum]